MVTTTAPVVPRSRKIRSVNWAFCTVELELPSSVIRSGEMPAPRSQSPIARASARPFCGMPPVTMMRAVGYSRASR